MIAPAPTTLDVYHQILYAVRWHTTAGRAPLFYAAWCAYHAVEYRAAGAERQYATHALAMRRSLQDARFVQPSGVMLPLGLAIEALLRGQCDAVLAHLEQLTTPVEVGT